MILNYVPYTVCLDPRLARKDRTQEDENPTPEHFQRWTETSWGTSKLAENSLKRQDKNPSPGI